MKHVAVVGDFESFFFAIRSDQLISNPQSKKNRIGWLGGFLARELITIAKTFGDVPKEYRIGAVSYESRREFFQEQLEFLYGIGGEGFQMMLVPEGFNAADSRLAREVRRDIAKDGRISTVVLATTDGREPFRSLIEHLSAEKKKRVHLVVYDTVPYAVKRGMVKCECSRLAPILYRRNEEMLDSPPEQTLMGTVRANRTRSPASWYFKAIIAIREQKPFDGEPLYMKHAETMLGILPEMRPLLRRLPVGKIAGSVQKKMEEKGVSLAFEKALDLVYGAIKADEFFNENVYSLRKEGAFAEQAS